MQVLHYYVEAAIAVYQFHYSHGSDKEYYNFTCIAEGLDHVGRDIRVVAVDGIDGPQQAAHNQSEYGLIDVQYMLRRYHQIAQNEDY